MTDEQLERAISRIETAIRECTATVVALLTPHCLHENVENTGPGTMGSRPQWVCRDCGAQLEESNE
jgi:transposase-like protein